MLAGAKENSILFNQSLCKLVETFGDLPKLKGSVLPQIYRALRKVGINSDQQPFGAEVREQHPYLARDLRRHQVRLNIDELHNQPRDVRMRRHPANNSTLKIWVLASKKAH